jgi:predicted kinase
MIPESLKDSSDRILRLIPLIDQTSAAPALFVISGLPGTGKSFLARRIAQRLPCVIVETDFVRKTLIRRPAYTGAESARVHRIAQHVLERLLTLGYHAIYDATNLAEWHREVMYRLADKTHSRLVLIRTIAPESIVRERLARRSDSRDPYDHSDANWQVHELLKTEMEPLRRSHIVVDTSGDIDRAVDQILRTATE